MNSYTKLKQRHQEEVNKLPIAFAFNSEQFAKGMRSLGLEPTDGITEEEIEKNPALKHGLEKARKAQFNEEVA